MTQLQRLTLVRRLEAAEPSQSQTSMLHLAHLENAAIEAMAAIQAERVTQMLTVM